MNIPIQVTVDLIQEYQLFTFTAKQKDIGRSAVITVTANGQVIPVTEADGANIYIAKPDGTKVYNACRFDNGRVVAELTNQMLASAGTAKVELELGAASGSRITTPIFNLKVLPTQIDGTAIESSNEFTALQQALLQVGEIATMRADIGDLTKLKTTAKSSLVDAVNEQNSKFAPAGYGLGVSEPQKTLSDCNDGKFSGWYKTVGSTLNSPYAAGGWMRADMFSGAYGTQTWYCEANGGISAQRIMNLGVWQPWEWVNPPMELNTEYRTTERYKGKPVYVKIVSVKPTQDISGTTGLEIGHDISNLDTIVRNHSRAGEYPFPTVSYDSNTNIRITGVSRIDNTKIYVRIINDVWSTATTWYFTLYYTKN